MKITINGGHFPGHDSGAVGRTGVQEADINRDIMLKVADFLRAVSFDVREVQVSALRHIIDASKEFESDLFVSIHCNGSYDADAQGTETFCYALGGESEKLAACIQQQVITHLGTVDRGVKTGNFYVLRMSECPAVLVETAFITNENDEALLADEVKRDEFAAAIARGITDYLSI
ncbi:N-acetylmuramoyl-L-alanine amidase family protein [Pelosinus propionicus]|uniref:N-acetylmuramoyl-L-alanine amidase n=1 Tax=Pelosinus propionicus DSM 13327 TaxID=1123291 RepID=A0A1I4NM57_9FIRM|nr:N-acetylmuramoyl-L-alanine amidase [Pelosinus propionicus]SFM16556.1 N-acetylmuramoyl-L-alanine amidase [Pelosinus propionicus DSM 13327]